MLSKPKNRHQVRGSIGVLPFLVKFSLKWTNSSPHFPQSGQKLFNLNQFSTLPSSSSKTSDSFLLFFFFFICRERQTATSHQSNYAIGHFKLFPLFFFFFKPLLGKLTLVIHDFSGSHQKFS